MTTTITTTLGSGYDLLISLQVSAGEFLIFGLVVMVLLLGVAYITVEVLS
jgi:hypothetical protein